jgi:lauroyl/myristoyl acyltransferase
VARDLLAALPNLRRLGMRAVAGAADAMPLGLARVVAYNLATVAWLVDGRGRRTVARNLAAAVPPGETMRRAVRRSYTEFALTLAEASRLHHDGWLLPGVITVHDPWRVFAARPLRGPAILATVHSHWDMLAAALHRLRLTDGLLAPALAYGDPALDTWLAQRRGAWGCRTVTLDRAPLALLRALRDGRVLGMLVDRDYSGHGLDGVFLGRPTRLPSGPAALAVQTKAPVIPMLLARRSPSSFTLLVGKPLRPDAALPRGAQVADLTRRIAAATSRLLSAAPAQWVAFHEQRLEAGSWRLEASLPLNPALPPGTSPAAGLQPPASSPQP